MPEWKIHDKWAEKVGVSTEVSKQVNDIIDFPQNDPEYLDYCADINKWKDYYTDESSKWPFKARAFRDMDNLQNQLQSMRREHPDMFCKWLYIGHDSARTKKLQAFIQWKYLSGKGAKFVEAWYLHHVLDYMEHEADSFSLEEIFKRLEEKIKISDEFDKVRNLIRGNRDEILMDLGFNDM